MRQKQVHLLSVVLQLNKLCFGRTGNGTRKVALYSAVAFLLHGIIAQVLKFRLRLCACSLLRFNGPRSVTQSQTLRLKPEQLGFFLNLGSKRSSGLVTICSFGVLDRPLGAGTW